MKWNWKHIFPCLLIVLMSCSDDDGDSNNSIFQGFHYVPLRVGQEHVYQIDSIIYDDFTASVDTISFQQRHWIEKSQIDDAGRLIYVVQVFDRKDSTESWRINYRSTRFKNTIRYELFENNLRKIGMVFPVENGKTWNSNSLNIQAAEDYSFQIVNVPFLMNNQIFDSTLTIIQREEENLIERFYTEEKYATNTGLVYREDINLRTGLDGEIEKGYEARMRLLSFKP